MYVDDYLAMAITTLQEQVQHVANADMQGVHNVLLADKEDYSDPLSLKKLKKKEEEFALLNDMLVFDFDGGKYDAVGGKNTIVFASDLAQLDQNCYE